MPTSEVDQSGIEPPARTLQESVAPLEHASPSIQTRRIPARSLSIHISLGPNQLRIRSPIRTLGRCSLIPGATDMYYHNLDLDNQSQTTWY